MGINASDVAERELLRRPIGIIGPLSKFLFSRHNHRVRRASFPAPKTRKESINARETAVTIHSEGRGKVIAEYLISGKEPK